MEPKSSALPLSDQCQIKAVSATLDARLHANKFGALVMSIDQKTIPISELSVQYQKQALDVIFGNPKTGPARSRKKYIDFLSLISRFLGEANWPASIHGELDQLAHALAELDHGRVREFLKPNKAFGRTVDPGDKWALRGIVAIVVEMIMSSNVSRREAASIILRHHEHLIFSIAGRARNLHSAIIDWHRTFLESRVSDQRAQNLFNQKNRLYDLWERQIELETGQKPTPHMIGARMLTDASLRALQTLTADEQNELRQKLIRSSRSWGKPPS